MLDLEAFSLLRLSGQTRPRELVQVANTDTQLRSTLCAHAALLLRSNEIVELHKHQNSDPVRIGKLVKNFGELYAHTDDTDTRAGMLEDFKSLAKLEMTDVKLGDIDGRFFDAHGVLHVPPMLRHVADLFLSYLPELTSVDLGPLCHATSIGSWFLVSCTALTKLDVTPLKHVTKIEMGFLIHCMSLTELNFEQMGPLDQLGTAFLFKCVRLRTIDITPLARITSIANVFLSDCAKLVSLDLGPLSNVTRIGDEFLSGCSGLLRLDLGPLRNVTVIGNGFLKKCSGLMRLDLAPLSNVTHIGNYFMAGCKNILWLNLSVLRRVVHINRTGFLMQCHALREVDYSPVHHAFH